MGPSSIPISILKILKSEFAGPLQVIFNTSFLTRIVPDKFKLARVIPVFKKGSQTNLSNHRPISLWSVFNKLLEKLMFNRLQDFLEKRYLIYNKQFGFRSHHSLNWSCSNQYYEPDAKSYWRSRLLPWNIPRFQQSIWYC